MLLTRDGVEDWSVAPQLFVPAIGYTRISDNIDVPDGAFERFYRMVITLTEDE